MNLPEPPAVFRWSREPWGQALRCVPLESQAQHLFTTRQLQLHAAKGGDVWELVAASVGASANELFRIKQVHGRHVHVVRDGDDTAALLQQRPDADAIISNAAGFVLAVQVADCVPMLIADPRAGAAGAVHAGWRGTAAGIARDAVEAMQRELGSAPGDLTVALGPSIGSCCYHVGEELVEAFHAAGATADQLTRWFSRPADGSLVLDLWQANHDQLVGAGVRPDHIHLSRLCTQTHASVFDSYRAAGPRAGRMIAAIAVPDKRPHV